MHFVKLSGIFFFSGAKVFGDLRLIAGDGKNRAVQIHAACSSARRGCRCVRLL